MPTRGAMTEESIPDGLYYIQNVHWLTFLELPNPRDTSHVVSAKQKKKESQWWEVTNLGYDRKVSIKNFARANDAKWGLGCQKASTVVRRTEIEDGGIGATYTIQPTRIEVYWGLVYGAIHTEVELYALQDSKKNQWYFIPVN
ncbi:hypothetical protein BD410DRAFT_810225 [Rickenella mellea]|uniref:Ricin B lectin domain-containing protein n=1 Tax=Rickenella mellea TaxID=50990 RepID=A0A4Y7PG50_9AGAM|nr:hypothetical protein BD410DRAFT_810225 [Rickenella mellea]